MKERNRSVEPGNSLVGCFCAKCWSVFIDGICIFMYGICILAIPAGIILLITGLVLIARHNSEDISNIDDKEKDVKRY